MPPEVTLAHHPNCPFEYAWDVAGELGAQCSCPRFWPHRVCTECWRPPRQHGHFCSQCPPTWIAPERCLSPHYNITDYKHVDTLVAAFRSAGWAVEKPALVGYRQSNGFIQLLSGTHRHAAAVQAGLQHIPVRIHHQRHVKAAWGDLDAWKVIMQAPAAGAPPS